MFGHDDQNNNNGQYHQSGGEPHDDQSADMAVNQHNDGQDASDNSVSGPVVAATPAPATPPAPADTDGLLDIKQEALRALTPLVGQLDQTPEEQFRTTMMMIQASDDHSLVQTAYQAAKQITSEKERAQALLDIVNEINYFTQHVQG